MNKAVTACRNPERSALNALKGIEFDSREGVHCEDGQRNSDTEIHGLLAGNSLETFGVGAGGTIDGSQAGQQFVSRVNLIERSYL